MKKYQIIYADPPWSYKVYSKKGLGRSAESHYPTMCIEDICALPVGDLADKDCALFLWVTIPCLLEGLSVLRAWGFTYKTIGFVWVKQNKKSDSLFWGMGYWTRSNVELCIPNDNPETVRCGYVLNSHPAVLDGFIDLVREEQQLSRTQGEKIQPSRPSVRDKLKQELPAHKPAAPKKREPER